jgi:hypothetical protein
MTNKQSCFGCVFLSIDKENTKCDSEIRYKCNEYFPYGKFEWKPLGFDNMSEQKVKDTDDCINFKRTDVNSEIAVLRKL